MILVERDRSAIKNLHEEEVMQVHVSGAPGQLRSNVQQFTVEPSPEWHAAGREVGLAPQICGARFLEIGSPNWRRSQVAFERHFFGRSQLAPEPAPESAPRLNVPVKCGHDDDVNPVASNLFFFPRATLSKFSKYS